MKRTLIAATAALWLLGACAQDESTGPAAFESRYRPLPSEPVILQGSGLAGSLMSAYLAQRGIPVEVYERRVDMRRVDISAGRSINLALSVRGLTALREVGIEEEIKKICIPMRGRVMHARNGDLTYQSYSKDGKTAINSVSRGELNQRLMSIAEAHGNVNLHFEQKCLYVDARSGTAHMRDERSGKEYNLQGQTLIGADGAFSGVRRGLQRTPRFNYSQSFLTHGYKELAIPPAEGGGWRIEKNALHIWPRGEYMLIALPNLDGSFTVTLFFPYEGKDSFASLQSEEAVMEFFQREFGDAVPLMPDLLEDYFDNPVGDLVTVRCDPWSYKDKVALVGDAAHAIVPFFGQGMNAAFEDCTELNACIGEFGAEGWESVFANYQQRRVANANAIADMAIENYIEMRDKVGDERWLFRKEIEHQLEQKFPQKYISRYEMVSFTRTPYAEAYRKGEINEKILHTLAEGINSTEKLNWSEAESLVNAML